MSRGSGEKLVLLDAVAQDGVTFRTPTSFISEEVDILGGISAATGELGDLLGEPQRHILLAASEESQLSYAIPSWPDREGPLSLYTYYLVQEMAEASNSDTLQQLHDRVASGVVDFYQNDNSVRPQDPQILGRDRGLTLGVFFEGR